jgi:hypothetical protein
MTYEQAKGLIQEKNNYRLSNKFRKNAARFY